MSTLPWQETETKGASLPSGGFFKTIIFVYVAVHLSGEPPPETKMQGQDVRTSLVSCSFQ